MEGAGGAPRAREAGSWSAPKAPTERAERGRGSEEGRGESEAKERRASEVLATMKPDRNREHQRMYRY